MEEEVNTKKFKLYEDEVEERERQRKRERDTRRKIKGSRKWR